METSSGAWLEMFKKWVLDCEDLEWNDVKAGEQAGAQSCQSHISPVLPGEHAPALVGLLPAQHVHLSERSPYALFIFLCSLFQLLSSPFSLFWHLSRLLWIKCMSIKTRIPCRLHAPSNLTVSFCLITFPAVNCKPPPGVTFAFPHLSDESQLK